MLDMKINFPQETNKLNDPLTSNHMSALSEYIFFTKYAKYDSKNKRRETWTETVDRSRNMHLHRYGPKGIDAEINWAFDMVEDKRVLPSMRSLQFGGNAIIANDARMYNCSFSIADRVRFFQETLWMLLSGCGVGFSVQKQHVAKLPDLIDHIDSSEKPIMTYTIADSIEGWADALGMLMRSYFKDSEIAGREIFFDFTSIRRKGSWLKTSGGRAPGPKPLEIALKRIKKVLRDAVESGCKKLKPIQVYDIVMMASDSVLAGGIRRSACLTMFSKDDDEMMSAKSSSALGKVLTNKNKNGIWQTEFGEAQYLTNDKGKEPVAGETVYITWYNLNPWRARSNNSVALLRNEVQFSDFNKIIENTKNFGEPGFLFTDNLDYGFNPCAEIILNPIDPITGETGWGVCNLCEINGAKIKTKEDFKDAVKAASIIGTLQAGYTYFNYLKDAARNCIRREALLGISLTGWMDNAPLLLDPEVQREMALYAVEVNAEFADKIGINQAARVTTTKPSGTTSLVLGTGSGIHPQHARRYFRRVQAAAVEKPLQYFKLHNPHMVEKSQWGKTDEVITFCVEVPETAIVKKDITAIPFLEIVKNTYLNWVVPGTARPDSSPGAVHNVSNTVMVNEDEWDLVSKFIFDNRACFSGISLLPKTGDKIYKQAPLEAVESEEDIKKWNEMVKNYTAIDWSLFEEMDDNTDRQGEVACHGGACEMDIPKSKVG